MYQNSTQYTGQPVRLFVLSKQNFPSWIYILSFWSFWLLFCYCAPLVYFCYVWYFVLSFFHRSFCLALFKPELLIPIRLFWTDSDPNLKKARLRILFLVWIPRCKIPLESNISFQYLLRQVMIKLYNNNISDY